MERRCSRRSVVGLFCCVPVAGRGCHGGWGAGVVRWSDVHGMPSGAVVVRARACQVRWCSGRQGAGAAAEGSVVVPRCGRVRVRESSKKDINTINFKQKFSTTQNISLHEYNLN